MQDLSKILENSVSKKPSQAETSLTTYEPNSTGPTDSYKKRMLLVVADSFELSAQNPTMAEKVSRAETWSRHLWGVIPETRLKETFDRAFKAKTDGFPVSAYDLNDAWNVIQTEDEERIAKEKEALRESQPIDHCSAKYKHINEIGEIEILYGGPGGIEANVPCPFCRQDANAQAMANLSERLKAKHGEKSNVVAMH